MSNLEKPGDNKTELSARNYQPVRAARGTQLDCAGWPQESAQRMLMNSLDEDVAEQAIELIACGATRKVLHDWDSYHASVAALKSLKGNETLLVQSGRPAGVFKTHDAAPRVLIVNSNTADRIPSDASSNEIKHRTRATPPCTTAASWTYIGVQEELPTAFHTLDSIAQKHFDGNLGGKLIVSGGLGAAGGALSLAAGMLGAAFLGIDVDQEQIKRRIRAGSCDYCVNTLDEALRILKNAVRQKHAVSVGLVGNCADVIPELASRGVLPDILTDQTSAHDLLNGYIPSGLTAEQAATLRRENSGQYLSRAHDSVARHFSGMLALKKLGSVVFEFGNSIQAAAHESGLEGNPSFPDFAEAYLQHLLGAGMAPVRWVALSGEPGDIQRLDDLALELFPDDMLLTRWIPLAQEYVRFQGLPARVCWLGPKARSVLADRANKLVAEGALKAPIVFAMEQAESSPARLPHVEPKGNRSESPGTSDSPLPVVLLNAASGASWVSIAREADYCQASVAMVADGTRKAANAFPHVLKNDFAAQLVRLADASPQESRETRQSVKLQTPLLRKP